MARFGYNNWYLVRATGDKNRQLQPCSSFSLKLDTYSSIDNLSLKNIYFIVKDGLTSLQLTWKYSLYHVNLKLFFFVNTHKFTIIFLTIKLTLYILYISIKFFNVQTNEFCFVSIRNTALHLHFNFTPLMKCL